MAAVAASAAVGSGRPPQEKDPPHLSILRYTSNERRDVLRVVHERLSRGGGIVPKEWWVQFGSIER